MFLRMIRDCDTGNQAEIWHFEITLGATALRRGESVQPEDDLRHFDQAIGRSQMAAL
jgi:hypothetical protein